MFRYAIVVSLIATPALAQSPAMPGMAMPGPAAEASPSSEAFKRADDTMMRAMERKLTGNADQDFVAGMVPHHQGAVDMAKVELQYGHDPDLLKLARDIIEAQNREIALMQSWQKAHPQP